MCTVSERNDGPRSRSGGPAGSRQKDLAVVVLVAVRGEAHVALPGGRREQVRGGRAVRERAGDVLRGGRHERRPRGQARRGEVGGALRGGRRVCPRDQDAGHYGVGALPPGGPHGHAHGEQVGQGGVDVRRHEEYCERPRDQ